MRKQFNILGGECTRTRPQPSMRGTEWSASKIVYMAGGIAREADASP
jgi:hypothetical protein